MNKPFNNLSPSEMERLDCLTEEIGEVLQIIGKIKRHGYNSVNPTIPEIPTNREMLEKELGDLQFCINWLKANNDVSKSAVASFEVAKSESIKKWLHHHDEFLLDR